MDNWYKKDAYIKQIVDFAFDMEERYPNTKIISIGQSPAWIIHGVGMIRKLRGEPANVSYAPFTGNFFNKEETPSSQNGMEFKVNKKKYPHDACLQKYFNFTSTNNLSPQQLLEETNNGQKVVLAEMINTGTGLASFLSAWTSQEFPDTIKTIADKIELFVYDTNPTVNSSNITIDNHGDQYSFPLTKKELSREEAEIMQNTASINECETESSRLVPMYRLCSGIKEAGLKLCKNTEKKSDIRGIIYKEIEKIERSKQRSDAFSLDHQ